MLVAQQKNHLPDSIQELDLSLVRGKLEERARLGREVSAPPVPLALLDEAIEGYRRFLTLNLRYPGFPIVPSEIIDEVWHQHALFTEMYAADCTAIFGEFRHHVPHFGRARRNVEQDKQLLRNTLELWAKEFGAIPASYDGMTALTCESGWSGNVDLTSNFLSWEEQALILRA